MKVLKYSPLLLLLLSGLFLVGCYTSLATRGHGDRYPENSTYNDDNSNNNDDSYTSQDTSYNDNQGDSYNNDGPYPYYGRFYSSYYPSVAIGFGVGNFYDPFYWDPFIYDGWCAPYYYSYNPFFYYPYWGFAFGNGFHHGHGWDNAGYYKTRTRDGFVLRNSGSRGSSYGVRGTLTRGTGIYSRNSDRTRLVSSNGITTTRSNISKTNITNRNGNAIVNQRSIAPNLRNRNNVINPRSNNPNVRNRNNVQSPGSYSPNIRNRNDIGRNRQNPNIRDNRNYGNNSRGNRPPQRSYNPPSQRNSSPTHGGNGSGRSSGSSNRSSGSSNRGGGSGSSGGGHSRR